MEYIALSVLLNRPCTMLQTSMHRYTQVYVGINRPSEANTGIHKYDLVYLVYTSIHECTQAYTLTHGLTHVCTTIHGYTQEYTDIHWYTWVYIGYTGYIHTPTQD